MDWSKLPPLAALRAFCAYCDTGSLQAAGDALNVTHAAISQQLRALETHLGVALLDRAGRSLALTPEGRILADTLTDAFGQIGQTVETLTGADADRPLHINTTPSFAAHWLMPRLATFRAAHPRIELMIGVNALLTDPKLGGIDATIRYGKGPWPGLTSELLIASNIVAVAAPSLIGDTAPKTPADLQKYPWLQELGTSEASKWLAQNGVADAKAAVMMHVPGNLMLDGARSGQGIGVTADIWVQEDLRAGRLVKLFESPSGQGYHLVTHGGAPRPALKHFMTWIRREARNR